MRKKLNDSSSVEKLLDTSIQKVKTLMDANSIVGDPVLSPGGTIIIPISKIMVGFVAGGGEYSDLSERRVANHYPMAGGTSGGMSVVPVGFLVETESELKYIDIENKNAYQTVLKLFNALAAKIEDEGEKNGKK